MKQTYTLVHGFSILSFPSQVSKLRTKQIKLEVMKNIIALFVINVCESWT
jgi:hypothetical protein